MLLTEKTNIKICFKNINHFNDKGYNIINGQTIEVNVLDLPSNSRKLVKVRCDNCGIEKEIQYCDYNKIVKEDKYYCSKCKWIKTKMTVKEKYGVENVFQSSEIKEKIKQVNQKKYGVDYPNQNPEIFNKVKKTNLKNFGVEFPTQNQKVLEKQYKTNIDKYNNSYSFMNDDVKNKISLKIKEKYGVNNPMQSNDIKNKSIETKISNLLKKYQYLNIIDIDRKSNIYKFKCDCGENHQFDITSVLLYNRLKIKTKLCTICNPVNSYNISGLQLQIQDFIKSNYNGDMLFNNRDIIKPYELDIYLPDLKIAFEFNGLHWHNELHKDNNYHLNKTEQCEKIGLKLIQIYEDDWLYKDNIVKSRILNLLNKSEKIYARKCEIKEINDNKIIREFLDNNHIQGFVGSSIKIGLFYNNELVSLMLFGSLRKSLGRNSSHRSYELLRFCNKLNFSVIGSASKLFKYFLQKYNPELIETYADRSWSSGKLYENLGFDFVHKTSPNYYYIIDGIRKHRFAFRKDILIKNGADKNKTEHQIMTEKGFYRIYDSGHLKYKYKNNYI